MPAYFITPNYSLALIPKNGCSTFARAVLKEYQPDDENMVLNAAYPEGKNADNTQIQWLANREDVPSKQVLAFIRDPYERFLSAMVQLRFTDVEAVLYALENGTHIERQVGPNRTKQSIIKDNVHFKHQYTWLNSTAKLYQFPNHINEGSTEMGFSLPLPFINPARAEKPEPTQIQKDRILQYYSKDKELFDKIITPGVLFQDILDPQWLTS